MNNQNNEIEKKADKYAREHVKQMDYTPRWPGCLIIFTLILVTLISNLYFRVSFFKSLLLGIVIGLVVGYIASKIYLTLIRRRRNN